MARTKANSASTIEEKINVEAADEATKTVVTEEIIEKSEEKTTDKKAKKINDDDDVIIVSEFFAGKSVVGISGIINFDEKGKATVKGIEAKRLITIPGYKLA